MITVNVDKNISNEPFQCRSTDHWADDTSEDK